MKIIDMLNKIANGEDAPKKIKFRNAIWNYERRRDTDFYNYQRAGDYLSRAYFLDNILNEEIEIIEEEKKIPEKIEIYEDEEGCYFIDKHCKKIYVNCDEINFMVEEFNQLTDYLQSKGE